MTDEEREIALKALHEGAEEQRKEEFWDAHLREDKDAMRNYRLRYGNRGRRSWPTRR